MLSNGARRVWLTVGMLFSVSQLGATCGHPPRPHYEVGFVRIGDRLAVYTPICAGDTVTGVEVHQMPDPGTSGDVTLIWAATGPTGAASQAGLITLGEGFDAVRLPPPTTFDRTLGVTVETAAGRQYSGALTVPDQVAQFPAGTPVTGLSFDTEDGRVDHAAMRAGFEAEFDCG